MSNNPRHVTHSCMTSAKCSKSVSFLTSSLFKTFFYAKPAKIFTKIHTHTQTHPVIFNIKAQMSFPHVKAQILKMKENGWLALSGERAGLDLMCSSSLFYQFLRFCVVCILLWCQHMFVMLNLHHTHTHTHAKPERANKNIWCSIRLLALGCLSLFVRQYIMICSVFSVFLSQVMTKNNSKIKYKKWKRR